jgi:hypothetical protein
MKSFVARMLTLAVVLVASAVAGAEEKKDVVDTAVSAGNFKTLVAAVEVDLQVPLLPRIANGDLSAIDECLDGGVFDIPTTGEVIVPINAKLQVREPFMFAITIEKPGGVVVSSRERLPLLAKVE